MNMPKISIVMGTLLVLLGVAGAVHSAMHHGLIVTALIPFYFGDVFVTLGILSLAAPKLRKHLMHFLAMIALLGTLMAGAVLCVRWEKMTPVARGSSGGMTVLCALTLFFCVRSFVAARRARELGAATSIA